MSGKAWPWLLAGGALLWWAAAAEQAKKAQEDAEWLNEALEKLGQGIGA